MKKNYEIKYELSDNKEIKSIQSCLKNYEHSREKQIDIYYKVSSGRLKLRIINDSSGSLILYDRDETDDKRISKYTISKTQDFKELNYILQRLHGELVTVEKKRDIFIKKNIRVHIDKVKGLGKFLEVEIIYENFPIAKKQMKEIISMFGLKKNKFIKASYSDLLINKK